MASATLDATLDASGDDRDLTTPGRSVPRWAFALTVFAGSFLLFQVEPMVARLALPNLGGAAAVWNSAMLVYQLLLLAGYAWAHWLQRFSLRRQVLWQLGLLGASCLWLPVGLASMEPPTGNTVVLFVPLLLLVSVGPLILAVSAQAPLLQSWFSVGGGNPYPLYAASNLGSFAGLLSYPLVVEPTMGLQAQRWGWSGGYVALIALVATCGLLLARATVPGASVRAARARVAAAEPAGTVVHRVGRRRTALWVVLSAVPSGLVLSTTTHLSTDIMAMPLLWAIPLGLYLLSFGIAFADRRLAARLITAAAPAPLLVLAATALLSNGLSGWPVAALSLVTLLAVAVALHTRLYDSRPPAHLLTRFYLSTAVGGALGGLFCGLVAPLAFDWVYEHPLLVVAAAALVPLPKGPGQPEGATRRWRRALLVLAVAAPTAAGLLAAGHPLLLLLALGLGLGWLSARWGRGIYVGVVVAVMLALGARTTLPASFDGSRARSYFGVYTVTDRADGTARLLVHGGTFHGLELLDPARRDQPTMYFGSGSGVGLVLSRADELFGPQASVGVVGLGAGTLACYKQPGQTWRFFEIDPLVVKIARDSGAFHFLEDCAPDTPITVGDARLELEKIPSDSYDVLVVDAFSSDAIPMHLMTKEAFDLYDRVVRDDGLLLVHITNRFINLEPVLSALTTHAGWSAAVRDDIPDAATRDELGLAPSKWVALSRSEGVLDTRLAEVGGQWRPLSDDGQPRLWTDDYASVLPLLR